MRQDIRAPLPGSFRPLFARGETCCVTNWTREHEATLPVSVAYSLHGDACNINFTGIIYFYENAFTNPSFREASELQKNRSKSCRTLRTSFTLSSTRTVRVSPDLSDARTTRLHRRNTRGTRCSKHRQVRFNRCH